MAQRKLHADEVSIDISLVRRLLETQHPTLARLRIQPIPLRSTGTVNAVYRLGRDLCVRLPRMAAAVDELEKELNWLPRLASHLSLEIPEPVAVGRPQGDEYPWPWAVYRWIDGKPFARTAVTDERQAAQDLAAFVAQLRRLDPAGGPPSGRPPLSELDAVTREAIDAPVAIPDREAVRQAWTTALLAPRWDGEPVWHHGDLLPPNVLIRDGRLAAILDFGSVGIGDPALDLVPAWSLFGPDGRKVFRQTLGGDGGLWSRARGYALHQALLIIPYYSKSHPAFVTMARRTIREVLSDHTTCD